RAAIRAVLMPDPDCEDLYFVARPDGSHRFSRTLAEHERAIRAIRSGKERRP
ncbi:MAG: endolytic transglycosylase MltG, partial [Candidatus Eiseniibacteriota bacterium]